MTQTITTLLRKNNALVHLLLQPCAVFSASRGSLCTTWSLMWKQTLCVSWGFRSFITQDILARQWDRYQVVKFVWKELEEQPEYHFFTQPNFTSKKKLVETDVVLFPPHLPNTNQVTKKINYISNVISNGTATDEITTFCIVRSSHHYNNKIWSRHLIFASFLM